MTIFHLLLLVILWLMTIGCSFAIGWFWRLICELADEIRKEEEGYEP